MSVIVCQNIILHIASYLWSVENVTKRGGENRKNKPSMGMQNISAEWYVVMSPAAKMRYRKDEVDDQILAGKVCC